MSNLKEVKAAMPAEFVSRFKETADSYGMTHRQLAAACISIGFKTFFDQVEQSVSLEKTVRTGGLELNVQ